MNGRTSPKINFAPVASTLMEVRALSAEDVQECAGPLARILKECVAAGASVGFMTDLTRSQAEQYWQRIAGRAATGELIVFGAYEGNELIGTATLIMQTPPNQPHRADVAKVLVLPHFQRKGIARALMQELERSALSHGKDLLVLDTLTGSNAESFYANIGWKRVGEIPRYALNPDGEPRATMFFYKELS